jgi:hypothetical protein
MYYQCAQKSVDKTLSKHLNLVFMILEQQGVQTLAHFFMRSIRSFQQLLSFLSQNSLHFHGAVNTSSISRPCSANRLSQVCQHLYQSLSFGVQSNQPCSQDALAHDSRVILLVDAVSSSRVVIEVLGATKLEGPDVICLCSLQVSEEEEVFKTNYYYLLIIQVYNIKIKKEAEL